MIKFISVQIALSEQFEISFQDNAYLTAIAGLQTLERNGFWAVMPNSDYCKALSISERTLQNMSKELESKGLLLRGSGTQKRASKEFCEALILSKAGGAEFAGGANIAGGGAEFAPLWVQNLRGGGAEFAPNKEMIKKYDKENIDVEPEFLKKSREKVTAKTNDLAPLKALPLGNLESEEVRELWGNFLEAQTEKGKRVTRVQAEQLLKELQRIAGASNTIACQIISTTIAHGWASFYEPKNDGTANTPQKHNSVSSASSGRKSDTRAGHKVENQTKYDFD